MITCYISIENKYIWSDQLCSPQVTKQKNPIVYITIKGEIVWTLKLGPRLKHSLSPLLINIFAEGLSHSNEADYFKQIYGKRKKRHFS